MDLKLIEQIIRMAEQSCLTSLEVQEGDLRIKVSKEREVNLSACVPEQEVRQSTSPLAMKQEHAVPAQADYHEIKAPMLGVFYEAPSPENPPFVKVGDQVKKGDVLCIIEAMKLMNEITSDREGTIMEVSAQNGQIVEFGHVLYKIK